MRLKLSWIFERPGHSIPADHFYYLAGAIYKAIGKANYNLALQLHEANHPKLYTFSRLMIPERRIVKDRIIVESDVVHFFFSTLRFEIAKAVLEGFIADPEIRIEDLKLRLNQVEIIPEKKISNKEKFITLSPITASLEKNGKVIDLLPMQNEFFEALKWNLVKKYKLYHGKRPENTDLEFDVLEFRKKRVFIKEIPHTCCEMVFVAKGNPELLDIGYKTGFGEKNSLGFGMVKAV